MCLFGFGYLNMLNHYSDSKCVVMVQNKVVHLISMSDMMWKQKVFIMLWVIFHLKIDVQFEKLCKKELYTLNFHRWTLVEDLIYMNLYNMYKMGNMIWNYGNWIYCIYNLMDWMCSYNMRRTCQGWKEDGWKWGVKHIHAFTQKTHPSLKYQQSYTKFHVRFIPLLVRYIYIYFLNLSIGFKIIIFRLHKVGQAHISLNKGQLLNVYIMHEQAD